MGCAHTMRIGNRDGSVSCGDCGKTLKKPRKPKTLTLKGVAAHRFLRAHDPTFPLHPDDPGYKESETPLPSPATSGGG